MTTTRTTSRPSWDETWLSVAEAISLRSKCVRASVGAVIVAEDERISATGYNGPAKTFRSDGPDCTHWCARGAGTSGPATANYDTCPSIHAEINALLYVDRSRVEGGTIYLTTPPCMDCGKAISNSGLSRVVTKIRDVDARRNPESVFDYLLGCGIEVTVLPVDEGSTDE